jgi:hypothetical protein
MGWPRIVVSYVSGTTVHQVFCESLCRLIHDEAAKPPGKRTFVGWSFQSGLYVGENRIGCQKRFMQSKADVLLFIDTDISFPPDLPEVMARVLYHHPEVSVLAVNVPLGANATSAYVDDPDSSSWKGVTKLPALPIVEVDGVATAVCAFRRKVFEDVDAQFGEGSTFRYMYDGPTFIGEDLAACRRIKAVGHKIHMMRYPGVKHWKIQPLQDDLSDVEALMREEAS